WDPFGQPVDPVTFAVGTTASDDTGQVAGNTLWHQGALKPAESAGSALVVEMGVRLYVPSLGRFLQVDPIEGGVDNDYVWPTDPINKEDLTGKAEWWRVALNVGIVVGGIAAGLACAASIVCGIVAGAATAALSYTALNAGTRTFSWSGLAASTALGGLGGGLAGGAMKLTSWRYQNIAGTGTGVRFSGGGGRGTDFLFRGQRVFGIHSHRMPTSVSRNPIVRRLPHYHFRNPGGGAGSGIGRHRPFQGWW
ncbi:hypothetical protein, partial [Microbacterium sp. Cr-K29]